MGVHDWMIRAEGLGKRYQVRREQRPRYVALRDVLAQRVRGWLRGGNGARPAATEPFWALQGLSFQVEHGEVLGIIGRNGAGKSTLLKILSRITEPTEGKVRLRGRVASLLEVGTGFHPELTGRQNIYLNGAIIGMRRDEIRRKFDDIVAFAEVERFIDTPVKHYSSGMYVRLAFAVAAHLEPEILVVDEVLAVGDAAFQRKCLGKMGRASESGRTILFVSHQMQAIRQLCKRAIWLDRGRIAAEGKSDQVVDLYMQAQQRLDTLDQLNRQIGDAPADPAFRLKAVDVAQDGRSTTTLSSGKPVEIRIDYDVLQETSGLHVYFVLCDIDGSAVFDSLHNGDASELPVVPPGRYVSTALIPGDFLAGRPYELRIGAAIHCVRACFPLSPGITLHVHNAGMVNRAYPGYDTPGKLAPLIAWQTKLRPPSE
jgi:lipopolysaccharide transport system ATP-binding protein